MANKSFFIIKIVIVWMILHVSLRCYPITPPDWHPQKVEYSYPELTIVDSNLVSTIERMVLQDTCGYQHEYLNGYLELIIKPDTNGYRITIEYINTLRLYDYYGNNEHIGFCYINNKLCLIRGAILFPFFAIGENTKVFSTYMHPFPPIEDFPMWIIEYSDGEYTLIRKDCL